MNDKYPLENWSKILSFSNARVLSIFAQTNKIFRDLAHLELFSRYTSNYDDKKIQRHIMQYWFRNPITLFQRDPTFRAKLIYKLNQLIMNSEYHWWLPKRTYTCLTMLSAFEKNPEEFQENFLYLVHGDEFDPNLLLSVIMKTAFTIGDQNSISQFNDFLETIKTDPKCITDLLAADVPMDETLLIQFKAKLLAELIHNNPSKEHFDTLISTIGAIRHSLSSEEIFQIIFSLLKRLSDNPQHHMLDSNGTIDAEVEYLLRKTLHKLQQNQLNDLFKFILYSWASESNESTLVWIYLFAYLIEKSGRKVSSFHRNSYFVPLLTILKTLDINTELAKQITYAMCTHMEACDFSDLLLSLKALDYYFYQDLNQQEVVSHLYDNISNKTIDLDFKQESALFFKLMFKILELHPVILKSICKKLSIETCKLAIAHLLSVIHSDKPQLNESLKILTLLLEREDQSKTLRDLLSLNLSKNVIKQILKILSTNQDLLRKVHFTKSQADEYFKEFSNEKMSDEVKNLLKHLTWDKSVPHKNLQPTLATDQKDLSVLEGFPVKKFFISVLNCVSSDNKKETAQLEENIQNNNPHPTLSRKRERDC